MADRVDSLRANSVTRALTVTGDKLSILILLAAFSGKDRFKDIEAALGISKSSLAQKLKDMVDADLFARAPVKPGAKRFKYALTRKGGELLAFLITLLVWQRLHTTPGLYPTIAHNIPECGEECVPKISCRYCQGDFHPRSISVAAGPGAGVDYKWRARKHRRPNARAPEELLDQILSPAFNSLFDVWSFSIVSGAFSGMHRFDEFREELQIAPSILSDRLQRLIEAGILERRAKDDLRRPAYFFTPAGRQLDATMLALMEWGDRWLALREGPPQIFTHMPCGNSAHVGFVCDRCDRAAPATEFDIRLPAELSGNAIDDDPDDDD